ncbi:MAG TPA: hypothetical protein VK121_06075 [Pseudogracilibacillus sp.]|nr:hypothetical protein [Pseudogracilibacillus sp.]
MPISNAWVFTETRFKAEEFLANTKNIYRFVSQRPYASKNNPEDVGVTITLLIIKDSTDYGFDKKTGLKRDNNTLNSFDVTILNGKDSLDISKGDEVKLIDFIPEKSFVIGFDLILRFKEVKKINDETK